MDEFDEINPFGDEFRPDAPTPAPSPQTSPTPPPSPPPPHIKKLLMMMMMIFHHHPQPLMEEKKSTRKEWGKPEPVKKEYSHESTLLQTVNRLIHKMEMIPTYKVKSKNRNYGLKGKTIEVFKLKKIRDENLCEKKG